jgi:hypothetical protein
LALASPYRRLGRTDIEQKKLSATSHSTGRPDNPKLIADSCKLWEFGAMMSISVLGLIFIAVVIGVILVGAILFLFMQERGRRERDDRPPK